MILKEFKAEEHFEELANWWIFWRWYAHPQPIMFSDIGYVVECDGQNICAGWLYTTNSTIASIEWVVSNPYTPREVNDKCLDFLIECLSQRALKEGSKVVITSIKKEVLGKRLERLGFIKGDSDITQYSRIEWPQPHR